MSDEKVILMLLNQKFLPDIRVEQECDALEDRGYRVIIVANNDGVDSKEYEVVRVDPHEGLSKRYNRSLRSNPKLQKEIIEKLEALDVHRIDVVHVHDLLWSFLGFQLKDYYSAKMVIDLHENYPAMLEAVRNKPQKKVWNVIRKIAGRHKRFYRYEEKMLEKTDRFIVVVNEALERFVHKSFHQKGVVVSNTKNPSQWHLDELPALEDKLIVTYMGTIQDLRGLDTAIEAMNYIDQNKVQLNIVGVVRGDVHHQKFSDLIKRFKIKNVNLVEWQTNEEKAFDYIKKSHIGIVPHKDTALTQTTIPHKLFMYMAIGRPVLVSDVSPLKRVVEDAKNGMVFKADDPRDMASCLTEMHDYDALMNFSKNGRLAAETTYSWEKDKARLLNLYEELLSAENELS